MKEVKHTNWESLSPAQRADLEWTISALLRCEEEDVQTKMADPATSDSVEIYFDEWGSLCAER
jgi:hypothetical protein